MVKISASILSADFAALARRALAGIAARGRLPVVAGGTGLYVRALLRDRLAGRDLVRAMQGVGVPGRADFDRLLGANDPSRFAGRQDSPAGTLLLCRLTGHIVACVALHIPIVLLQIEIAAGLTVIPRPAICRPDLFV